MIEPKIGYWWAECCMEDLSQIMNEKDLVVVKEIIKEHEEEGFDLMVFPTYEEAAKTLA